MPLPDLLALLDREQEALAAENNHSAAALMRAAAAELRRLSTDQRERCAHGIKADCTACEPLARLRHR